jgi:phosphohistidine swiveling domain-containing protein
MKKELTLLGVWNQLPVGVWTWLNDAAVDHFEQLTGRHTTYFSFVKNELNYECFEKKGTDLLKNDLDGLSPSEQKDYVQKITDDYYAQATVLEEQIARLEVEASRVTELSSEEIAALIDAVSQAWLPVVMQIWYAVLLDIWYPMPVDKAQVKAIIAKARDHCGHLHERSSKAEHFFYMECAKRFNITVDEVYFLIQPEIIAALRGAPLPENLKARLETCVWSNHSGVGTIYAGEDAVALKEIFAVPTIGEVKQETLKGTPASKGEAKGKARVILLDKEFGSFEDGEILVSLTTMVHYVPLMKKAAAILTEFGGLTSHAAVVSRELGKPAIVGIPNLIASIKTGDMIEVDATKGTIRKIAHDQAPA